MNGLRRFGAALALAMAMTMGAAAADAPKVVVTIKPIHSLVAQLMQGIGAPTLLVDGAASPHSFALKPSAVRAVNGADVFVRVSDGLEPFTRKIVGALPASVRVVSLDETPGLKLLDRRASGTFEPHEHDSSEPEHVDAIAGKDGHIWLDPDNAKAIVAYLAKVIGERAPQYASQLAANAQQINARIDALAAELEAETRDLKGKPFVVFHDAYQYFEKRFGLAAAGSITMSPEVQPSAKRLTELRRRIAGLNAVCVFAEPLFQPHLLAAVTEGTNARSGTLDPEGMTLPAGSDLYGTLMRNLAANLRSCLAHSS